MKQFWFIWFCDNGKIRHFLQKCLGEALSNRVKYHPDPEQKPQNLLCPSSLRIGHTRTFLNTYMKDKLTGHKGAALGVGNVLTLLVPPNSVT